MDRASRSFIRRVRVACWWSWWNGRGRDGGVVRFGDLELIPLFDGRFRLDGGAMFGVVPMPLWERRAPADDRNRIAMSVRPLLVRTATQNVLIDAGIGDKMGEKETEIYAFDRAEHLDRSLAG